MLLLVAKLLVIVKNVTLKKKNDRLKITFNEIAASEFYVYLAINTQK